MQDGGARQRESFTNQARKKKKKEEAAGRTAKKASRHWGPYGWGHVGGWGWQCWRARRNRHALHSLRRTFFFSHLWPFSKNRGRWKTLGSIQKKSCYVIVPPPPSPPPPLPEIKEKRKKCWRLSVTGVVFPLRWLSAPLTCLPLVRRDKLGNGERFFAGSRDSEQL